MYSHFSQEQVAAAALVDPWQFRVAVADFPLARKPLLQLALFCESSKRLFDNQTCYALLREHWADDPKIIEAFTRAARMHAAEAIRGAGHDFDDSYFDNIPPPPSKEEQLATLNKEKDRLTAELKEITTQIKDLTRVDRPRADNVLYAREYGRYNRALWRLNAS